jgi:ABC-type branched-subunit amino acid transport system permease subunit
MSSPKHGSYVHFPSTMKSYLLSVLAIVVCAVPGALLAWLGMTAIGLSGIPLALATVSLGMVLAVVFFALLSALGRLFGISR